MCLSPGFGLCLALLLILTASTRCVGSVSPEDEDTPPVHG